MTSEEITKDILVSYINKVVIIGNPTSAATTIAEMYKIIYKAVDNP